MLTEIRKEDHALLRKYLDSRTQEIDADILLKVTSILNDVRKNQDAAAREYTKKFDGVEIDDFKVSEAEIDEAEKQCDEDFKDAMRRAASNIRSFHGQSGKCQECTERDQTGVPHQQ